MDGAPGALRAYKLRLHRLGPRRMLRDGCRQSMVERAVSHEVQNLLARRRTRKPGRAKPPIYRGRVLPPKPKGSTARASSARATPQPPPLSGPPPLTYPEYC